MDITLNPDRERMELSLVMALLVNGRTVFDDFNFAAGVESFAENLKEFGLSYVREGHQLVLTGKGFAYNLPSLLPFDLNKSLVFSEHRLVLLWTLASKDLEQIYTFASNNDELSLQSISRAKELLQKYFKIKIVTDEPAKFAFTFASEDVNLKKDSLGNIPYIMRNRILLRNLIRGGYFSFEEKSLVHDQFTKMLGYFGVNIKYEGRGMEQLTELERRMMMAQGKKVERTQFTEIAETPIITGREYFIPADTTEAMAFILLMTIGNIPKNAEICLKNVELNSSRAGALTCLKRMGANFETVSRREKFGDVYGDIMVYPMATNKRLQGRRFSEDVMATGIEEYPFLAVAACYAEGETILRVPKEIRQKMRPLNESLAINLRKTGAEVGVYDDGLVIRGLETIVNGSNFDGGESPENGLALSVLSMALENTEEILNEEIIEKTYPKILKKLAETLDTLRALNAKIDAKES